MKKIIIMILAILILGCNQKKEIKEVNQDYTWDELSPARIEYINSCIAYCKSKGYLYAIYNTDTGPIVKCKDVNFKEKDCLTHIMHFLNKYQP